MATNRFTLNTGAEIPAIGLGTWQSLPGQVKQAVSHAICSGYTHIDCAYCYGNEQEVGQGIKAGLEASGLRRSDLFITTKLWCTYHTRVEQCLDKSLSLLGLDYVDLYLMHWPVAMNPDGNHEKFPKTEDGQRDLDLTTKASSTYAAMERLLPSGKTRAIGVCNFSKRFLEDLLPKIDIVPAVNQIENHPLLPQQEIIEFCKSKGIIVEAYSPLGSTGSPLMHLPAVMEIAREMNTSAGAILLGYHNSRGVVALPKSVTPARIEQNLEVVKLSSRQMDMLNAIAKDKSQRMVYPEFGVNFGFPDKNFGIAHSAA